MVFVFAVVAYQCYDNGTLLVPVQVDKQMIKNFQVNSVKLDSFKHGKLFLSI